MAPLAAICEVDTGAAFLAGRIKQRRRYKLAFPVSRQLTCGLPLYELSRRSTLATANAHAAPSYRAC